MTGRPIALPLGIVALLAGCASSWAPRAERSAVALQWPFPPRAAKVTFERSLSGFGPAGGAGSALRSIVYGADTRQRGAFLLPVAVATGADGRIAVADIGCRCAHLFLPVSSRYLRLTGSERTAMQSPVAVVFDDESRLFVSDSAGSVFAFDAGGALEFTLTSAGPMPLRRPTGLAFSPRTHRLYVADTLAHVVYAFDRRRELAATFGGRGEAPGQFNFPTHLAWSPAGELYVTDALNFRVQIFDEEGHSKGLFGHHGDGSGDLAMPKGLAVDGDGVVYVADSLFDAVQLFDRDGTFLLTLGRRGVDLGEFWLPSGISFGAGGELYVCDTYNRRIQVFRIAQRYAAAAG